MVLRFPIPPDLRQIDYLQTRFHVQFQEDFHLADEMPLRLRRDLQRAERYAVECAGDRSFTSLLSPPLPTDPVALRRYQKPSPNFVLHPSPDPAGLYRAGSRWRLPVLFLGKAVQQLTSFHQLLQALGELGLHKCAGRFDVVAIEADNACGFPELIWRAGDSWQDLLMPVNSLDAWLDYGAVFADAVQLTMQTPARLISANRPLFRPTFQNVLPFILRRVTSLLYACGNLELADAEQLLQGAARIRETNNTLVWKDWRSLDGGEEKIDLGGVTGSVVLSGEGLLDLLWLLNVGSLCNLGRGASYGAGHYLLSATDSHGSGPCDERRFHL
jgi:hypothetical protein